MKKFLIQISFFLSPAVFCLLLVSLIDPYNFFRTTNIISVESKLKTINYIKESPLSNALMKFSEFGSNPCENILIGDSKGYSINENIVKQLTGKNFYNFSIPGANMETKFSIFWFASSHIKLRNVVFQVSFPNWIKNDDPDLYNTVQQYIKNPLLYITNPLVIRDSFREIKNELTNNYPKEENSWHFPITNKINNLYEIYLTDKYKNYQYPEKYYTELIKIADYCSKNSISFEIIALPIYQKFYDFLNSHNLEKYNSKYLSEICSVAKTLDFSSNKEINSKEDNFQDYVHQKQYLTDSITHIIWGRK